MADKNQMMSFHSSILQVASIIKNNEQKKVEESVEIEKKKRERKANYTQEETKRLVDILVTKKDILENKKSGSNQWKEKNQAWKDIEKAFNCKSNRTNYRDSKTLRIKYESLKRDVKRKWANIAANRRNCYGKLPRLTAAEKKIKEIIPLQIDGICDFSSSNDKSDDDDDDNDDSRDSNHSDSNTKDRDWSTVKKEVVYSDTETTHFEPNITVGIQPLLSEEPPHKRMLLDPLVEKRSFSEKTNNDKGNGFEEEKETAAKLQIELLREEIAIKKLQQIIMHEELTHKRTMHELEKEQMLLKIELLKKAN